MTTAAHSKLGASSYKRWKNCPGSIRLSEQAPAPRTSRAAQDGTDAHEIASNILLGKGTPKNIAVELLRPIMIYVWHIEELIKKSSRTKVWIEQRVDLSAVHPALFGTADAIIHNPDERALYVRDYKHGENVPVDAERNEQLMYYGLGSLLETRADVDFIDLGIVQPRHPSNLGFPKEWRTDKFEMDDFAVELRRDAYATENPDAHLSAGSHCFFCPAKSICPAFTQNRKQKAKDLFTTIETPNHETLFN
jgi:hypothetical protein